MARMPEYQHHFTRVEDYLHHRPPYLMIDRIVSIEPTTILTERTITGEDFFIRGHFPGAPILPGAMMQEMSTQSAGILIAARYNPMPVFNTHDPYFNEYALGVLVKVNQARFRGFARPGDTIQARVELQERVGTMFDFTASLMIGTRVIMRNRFQLTNILSAVLQGGDENAASP